MTCAQCGQPLRQVDGEWYHQTESDHFAAPDWKAEVERAVLAEREACARLAEDCLPALYCPPWSDAQRAIAAAIRERGGP